MEMLHKKHFYSLTPEEENSLEEFAWVFGPDAVKEIEKQVKYIVEQIHGISDLKSFRGRSGRKAGFLALSGSS